MTSRRVAGLVLAAGEGRRLGGPKALVSDATTGDTWLASSVTALRDGGVDEVWVVVGASAAAVRSALPASCRAVDAPQWRDGMGASLRAGMAAVDEHDRNALALVVMLVDTPGVNASVVRRLSALASRQTLARASYHSEPGHPVLIGRDHWVGVAESASGDRGARDYLRSHDVTLVECGDIGSGTDIDTAELLEQWRPSGDVSFPPGPSPRDPSHS